MTDAGWVKADAGSDGQAWQFGGAWTLSDANALDQATAALRPGAGAVTLDLSAIEIMDTAGAWLIMRTAERAEAGGAKVQWVQPPEALMPLLSDHKGFRRLELELGYRMSHYEFSEDEATWKSLIRKTSCMAGIIAVLLRSDAGAGAGE